MSNGRTNPVTGKPAKVWLLNDRLEALREWGTPHELKLSPTDGAVVTIGREPPVTTRLVTPMQESGQLAFRFPQHDTLSRLHAVMHRVDPSCWMIVDKGSFNGVAVDGLPSTATHVLPGQDIRLGRLRLLAISERVRAIQQLWTRYLTCRTDPDALARVDSALWSSHWLAMPHGGSLILRGRVHDLLAARLHAAWRGPERPFVCAETSNRPLSVEELQPLLSRAQHGTLFLREARLGKEAAQHVLDLLASPQRTAVRFIIAAPPSSDLHKAKSAVGPAPVVEVPDFAQRTDELPFLIQDIVRDHAQLLAARADVLGPDDDDWKHVAGRAWDHYNDLEDAVRKAVAIRVVGRHAARALGISYSAVSQFKKGKAKRGAR